MNIKNWQKIVIIICSILGTILHFTYDFSNQNYIVGLFSATNESTWEHLKLAFYPMLLMAIVGAFLIKKDVNNFWLAQCVGIITTLTSIVVIFYTYNGVLGQDIALIDILIFYVSVILGEFVIYKIFQIKENLNHEKLAIAILICMFFSFIVFTYNPIDIGLFKDPTLEKNNVL